MRPDEDSGRRSPERRLFAAVVTVAVCTMCAVGCGSSGSGVAKISDLTGKLEAEGLQCRDRPRPPDTVGLAAFDRFNPEEVDDCALGDVPVRINRWKSASAADDALVARKPMMCGNAGSRVVYVASGNWMIGVADGSESAAASATLDRIANRLGVEPTTIDCAALGNGIGEPDGS